MNNINVTEEMYSALRENFDYILVGRGYDDGIDDDVFEELLDELVDRVRTWLVP